MTVQNHVTVGIVGGGVAGLTLAKALERLGVSYALWESRSEVAPAAGASIGLMPNGHRILDQLGLISEVEKHAVPHHSWEHRDEDGSLYCVVTAQRSFPNETGYGAFFVERQRLLEILYNSIEDKTAIRTSKRVCSVKTFSSEALVTTTDGEVVSCQFVAGADGVRSIVRQEIESAVQDFQTPPGYLDSRVSCIYGISSPLPQIGPGRTFSVYRSGLSVLVFSGLGGIIYWFVFQDLKSSIPFGKTKRYTADDIEAVCGTAADIMVTTGVNFSDIYSQKTTAFMTALEEGIASRWWAGRMFLLGDSAHKMVPHAAMGGNQAMESVACFVNQLQGLRTLFGGTLPHNIPASDVERCLEIYAQRRVKRVSEVMKRARFTCRSQLKLGIAEQSFVQNLPNMSNEQWLFGALEWLSMAEKLENWDQNSDRVTLYDKTAQKMREKALKSRTAQAGVSSEASNATGK